MQESKQVGTSKQELIEKIMNEIEAKWDEGCYIKRAIKRILLKHLPEESPSDIGEKISEKINYYSHRKRTYIETSVGNPLIEKFIEDLQELKESLSITK